MSKPILYLLSALCSFVVLIALWCALFVFQLGLPTKHSYWTNALVKGKLLAAQNVTGEKLVFVAGSSGNFNIDSEEFSKLTNIQSVNLGTHAILPLEYMLDHTKNVLTPGDTVVLALEYLYFAADDRLSDAYIDYLISRDKKYFNGLPVSEKINVMTYVSLRRLLTPIKESFFSPEPSYAFNVYSEFFYSPYGDSHANNLIFLNQQMRDQRSIAPPEFRILSIKESKNNWLLLKHFSEWCKERNISLLAVPPATMKFNIYDQANYRDALENLNVLYADAGIKFIGDPYQVMYDTNLFFDTNYHANQLGKAAYTDTLIQWIKPYLHVQHPLKPIVVEETPVDQALRHFNGWMPISGLRTLEGPYPEHNLPVVAWGAPQTKLQLEVARSGNAEFKIEFLANLEHQPVAVLVDDVQIFSKVITKSLNFESVVLSFPLTQGKHVITINSSDVSSSDTGISLLYKTIFFTPPDSKAQKTFSSQ
ncbi:hypothetical protein [Pseudomonas sp. GL-RE-26]|uniref:hypothetical protein n=1 Tax=Pseudomonas sp. GL-RE-26 TaxID=2832390 RepID=UPI001CC0FA76|nr:hypothetical protein [Pseudomonas sp. GL-RE-26]